MPITANRVARLVAAFSVMAIATAPAAGAANNHGIREFTASGTWTAPAGITSVLVEMWGSGGGGDALGPYYGNGGNGAYSRSVVTVKPRKNYSVVVGAGGGAPDVDGGDSQFVSPDNKILLFAGGGRAGAKVFGSGGAGGVEDTSAMIHHPGNAALGGPNYGPYSGNSNPAKGFDGAGGAGGTLGSEAFGNPGYVLLIW